MHTQLTDLERILAASDPWQALEIKRSSDVAAVTKAFRELSRKIHPDKNPAHAARATLAFQRLQQFREIILEEVARHPEGVPQPAAPPQKKRRTTSSVPKGQRAEAASGRSERQHSWDAASRNWGPGYHTARRAWREAQAQWREAQAYWQAQQAAESRAHARGREQQGRDGATREQQGREAKAAACADEEPACEEPAWGPSHPGYQEAMRQWRAYGFYSAASACEGSEAAAQGPAAQGANTSADTGAGASHAASCGNRRPQKQKRSHASWMGNLFGF